MKRKKQIIIEVMLSELLKCYNSDGSLRENYYENIKLPYLEKNEMKEMIELSQGIF